MELEKSYVVKASIERETEKAVLLTVNRNDGEIWVPKSQTRKIIINGFQFILFPQWLFLKYKTCLGGFWKWKDEGQQVIENW